MPCIQVLADGLEECEDLELRCLPVPVYIVRYPETSPRKEEKEVGQTFQAIGGGRWLAKFRRGQALGPRSDQWQVTDASGRGLIPGVPCVLLWQLCVCWT